MSLLLVLVGATGQTAQAHWLHTPGQINRMNSANAKLEAYKENVVNATLTIRWVKHHREFFTFKKWGKTLRAHNYIIRFSNFKISQLQWLALPPHYSAWQCIHHYEGAWTDSGDPYWGGLQMDRGFMSTYAPKWLLAKGWANSWTPLEQMWVAERAFSSGRGYGPWPNTARYCGLL